MPDVLEALTKRVAELDARSRELMKQPFSVDVCIAVSAYNQACRDLEYFMKSRE